MNTNETRSESESAEVHVSATEQDVPERLGFVAKKIVPPLSTIAFTLMTVDWYAIGESMGWGNKGHGH